MSNDARKIKLLILDTSPSMAQVLKTYAMYEDYDSDVFSDSAQACTALTQAASTYDGVIVGWPKGQVRLIADFLVAIGSADHADLPLIVLSEETDKDVRTLARRRARTRSLLWRDYKRIEVVLGGIMSPAKPASGTANNINGAVDEQRASQPVVAAPGPIVQTRVPTSVLIVDDSPDGCHALRDLLEGNGYYVAVATSAFEARAALGKNHYDLVLTEFFLPQESGESLCIYLQALSEKKRPVFAVMTRRNLESVVQRSLAIGAITCLDKTEATDILFARLDAIAKGLSAKQLPSNDHAAALATDTFGMPVTTVKNPAAELVQSSAVPSILIDYAQNIIAANNEAANLLSAGDRQGLESKSFEKDIHGAPVKRSPEESVKALFRTLDGKTLSVAYRCCEIDAVKYGLSSDARLLTFKSVVRESAPVISARSVSDMAGITETVVPTKATTEVVMSTKPTPSVVEPFPATPALTSTTEMESPASAAAHTMIESAWSGDNNRSVFCLLMLDIKMVASITGDRLSLGKSEPMLELVKADLAQHYVRKKSIEYLGNGQFLVLIESEQIRQARIFAEKLVQRVPDSIAHLSDVELLSHGAFVELPCDADIPASYILKHCAAACLKVEIEALDNTIFEIDAANLRNLRARSLPQAGAATVA